MAGVDSGPVRLGALLAAAGLAVAALALLRLAGLPHGCGPAELLLRLALWTL